jgi:hypothetical protein
MRGTRVAAAVAAIALAGPVAAAHAHPADWMYTPGAIAKQIGGRMTGGAAMFMQRQETLPGSFEVVGKNPLAGIGQDTADTGRGMNAAIAVHKNYVYVGSRTDAKNNNANHAGIFVVDVHDPAQPKVVHEFEGFTRESSRELRVWRSQEILVVLHTNCGGNGAHQCAGNRSSFRFYDIAGENAAHPKLLYENTRDTHEFFIWEDPKNPKRALFFAASAGSQFEIFDISPILKARELPDTQLPCSAATPIPAQCAPVQPVRLFGGAHGFGNSSGSGIHSFTVSNDGKRLFLALLTRGFGVGDVSDFTDDDPTTNSYRLITPQANRVQWAGPGAHSAVKLWNKEWTYVSDEVYGTITAAGHGCPWGWARFVDIADPTRPVVKSEFRLAENEPLSCTSFNPPRTSYSAHNPTLTPSIAFSTWHSGGFQAIDITNPAAPTHLAEFFPEPLAMVTTEDPRLTSDPDTGRHEKIAMWSYPVIQDGLIYTVDLRNGLYILKYRGPYQDEIDNITFLEGNSNQGDALCFEPVPGQHAVDCATSAGGSSGGTVPATLSLTVGNTASFGAFTPGVAKDYNASTTASVISTAGDATLAIADNSTNATGRLVNGAFSLPAAVQARAVNAGTPAGTFAAVGSASAPTPLLAWTAPVSNDPVTLDFRQSIGAGDALRTGSYSKTFTLTLSTTTP